jgi:hypothetical protein
VFNPLKFLPHPLGSNASNSKFNLAKVKLVDISNYFLENSFYEILIIIIFAIVMKFIEKKPKIKLSISLKKIFNFSIYL